MISQERNGRTYTYLYDGHGSVVGLMSESGSVTDTYTYDAFGNLLKSTGGTENNYRYCGEQFDSTTGLYYLRARYMDASTGRFISQDSYAGSIDDPVSLHKYLYANSNPVMYIDPSGYEGTAIEAVGSCSIVSALASTNTLNAVGILKSIMSSLAATYVTVSCTYDILDDIVTLITDLSSGSKTSVDVNAQVREEAVDGATGGAADGAGSGGAAPNPDDNGNKNGKNNKNKINEYLKKLKERFGIQEEIAQNGKGYRLKIKIGRRELVIRIMDAGSGGRDKPYIKIGIDGKQSFNRYGYPSNNPAEIHIDLDSISIQELIMLIEKILEG